MFSFLFLPFTADGVRPRQSKYPWRCRFSGPSYWVSYMAKIKIENFRFLIKSTNSTSRNTDEGTSAVCYVTAVTLLEILRMQRSTQARNKMYWFIFRTWLASKIVVKIIARNMRQPQLESETCLCGLLLVARMGDWITQDLPRAFWRLLEKL